MSNQYKHGEHVPSDVLINRAWELVDAITKRPDDWRREFTMRVPAELDRDADCVIAEMARRIPDLEQQVEALREAASDAPAEAHGRALASFTEGE